MPRFITKKWIEVHHQSGETYNTNEQIRFKTSMPKPDLCDCNDAYIIVKETITVTNANNDAYDKKLALKIMHHLFLVFQKLIIHLLIMQKIYML